MSRMGPEESQQLVDIPSTLFSNISTAQGGGGSFQP